MRMISGTGSEDPGRRSRSGFTLVEFLIILGLMAIVGGLVAMNVDSLISGLGDKPVERTFREALQEARFQSASLKETVRLRYDEEAAAFELFGESGSVLDQFPTRFRNDPRELRIEFRQFLPSRGTSAESRPETVELEAIAFRPDRSSTPFEVEFSFESQSFRLRFDPFSDSLLTDSREN